VENPEVWGVGGILVAVATAWFKMKPAMLKTESEADNSLRGDLLARITKLEADMVSERNAAHAVLEAVRREHETAMSNMTRRHNAICQDYETKLNASQQRIDSLTDRLIQQTLRNI